MTAPARRAAHTVIRAVNTRRENLAQALDRVRHSLPDPRDRALVNDIALGVFRWRAALDHVLQQLSSRPLSSIDASVLDILRAAVYQLLYLTRVPRHAIIADAVSLTREFRAGRASGFVNGILRTLAEERRFVSLPAAPISEEGSPIDRTAALDYLNVTLSHPRWLVERWIDRAGWPAAAAWARFNNRPAPVTIRPDLTRGTRAQLQATLTAYGVETTPTRLGRHGLIATTGNPLTTPPAKNGNLFAQEEASQLIVELTAELIARAPDAHILDLCAAPGGKTIALANATDGILVASDLRLGRVALLSETFKRHRLTNVPVVRLDAEAPLPFGTVFGGILVDAPCSGLGIIRRDPDIRWRRKADQLASFADCQLSMLTNAAKILRPTGWLVYSTCSSEPEENEDVISKFLKSNSSFRVIRPSSPNLVPLVDADGFLRTLPFRDGVDAFFAAVLHQGIA